MSATTDKAIPCPDLLCRLDTVRMSGQQRRQAEASLRDGELVAALVLHLTSDAAAIARGIVHAVSTMANGVKALLAKPVKH